MTASVPIDETLTVTVPNGSFVFPVSGSFTAKHQSHTPVSHSFTVDTNEGNLSLTFEAPAYSPVTPPPPPSGPPVITYGSQAMRYGPQLPFVTPHEYTTLVGSWDFTQTVLPSGWVVPASSWNGFSGITAKNVVSPSVAGDPTLLVLSTGGAQAALTTFGHTHFQYGRVRFLMRMIQFNRTGSAGSFPPQAWGGPWWCNTGTVQLPNGSPQVEVDMIEQNGSAQMHGTCHNWGLAGSGGDTGDWGYDNGPNAPTDSLPHWVEVVWEPPSSELPQGQLTWALDGVSWQQLNVFNSAGDRNGNKSPVYYGNDDLAAGHTTVASSTPYLGTSVTAPYLIVNLSNNTSVSQAECNIALYKVELYQ